MSPGDRFREMAPLAALDALDGQDLLDFREHLPGCAECQAELAAYEETAGRLGASLGAIPPPPAVRQRVLARVGAAAPAPPRVVQTRTLWWPAALAAAAAVALAFWLESTHSQLEKARQRAAALEQELEQGRREVAQLREALLEAGSVRDLVVHPETRLTSLAGLPPAPQARGRVIWNAATREALLLATGLQKPPEGQAYEAWVIGPSSVPVPAGVFQPRPDGSVLVSLPRVEDTSRPRTFAVTLEPAAGSAKPTGPMVLAGAVS